MSSEVVLNPEQAQNLCDRVDHLFIDRFKSSELLSLTSE